MLKSSSQSGHSARVEMRLFCRGESWRVVQLGPDFLCLENPIEHPPTDAELEFDVDGAVRRWSVRLPSGISSIASRVDLDG